MTRQEFYFIFIFIYLFQFCDVAQVAIIHNNILAKLGNIQNMKSRKKNPKHPYSCCRELCGDFWQFF
jgi:hypothetical protein